MSKVYQERRHDSRVETYKHIHEVQKGLGKVIRELTKRSEEHDQSKLVSPEVEYFDEFTPKLAETTYGSDEYKGYLTAMKPGLDHHYKVNDHHPENGPEFISPEINQLFEDIVVLEASELPKEVKARLSKTLVSDLLSKKSRINNMNLWQVVEMLVDWRSASLRHDSGDIRKSIEFNQKRFGYSDDLKQIFLNSLELLENEVQL